jgi:hypothetical protein
MACRPKSNAPFVLRELAVPSPTRSPPSSRMVDVCSHRRAVIQGPFDSRRCSGRHSIMMTVPVSVKMHLALGYSDIRKGLQMVLQRSCGRRGSSPLLGSPLRVPWQECIHAEDPLLGRQWTVLVHQENRSRRVHLPAHHEARQHHHLERCATRDADRGHRLANTSAHMEAEARGVTRAQNHTDYLYHSLFAMRQQRTIAHAV